MDDELLETDLRELTDDELLLADWDEVLETACFPEEEALILGGELLPEFLLLLIPDRLLVLTSRVSLEGVITLVIVDRIFSRFVTTDFNLLNMLLREFELPPPSFFFVTERIVLPIELEDVFDELPLVPVLLVVLELTDLTVELRVTVRFPDELLAEVVEELFVVEPEDTPVLFEPLDLITVLPEVLLLFEEVEPEDVPLLVVELEPIDLPVELRVTVRLPDELLAEVVEELFVVEPEDMPVPLELPDLIIVLPEVLLLLEEAELDNVPFVVDEPPFFVTREPVSIAVSRVVSPRFVNSRFL